MPYTLNSVALWGRSFDEYSRMFDLSDRELTGRILGCADGPASFNVEANAAGFNVVSCDPIYRYGPQQIRDQFERSFEEMLDQTRKNHDAFIWSRFGSVENLGKIRRSVMEQFLDDFECGLAEGRYRAAQLPTLDFDSDSFDLAL